MRNSSDNRGLFQLRMWKYTIPVLILLMLTVSSPGCDSDGSQAIAPGQGNNTTSAAKIADIKSLEIVLQRYIPGTIVQFLLVPRDSGMFLVPSDGSVTARLWLTGFHDEKDSLIQEWSDVPVITTDYNVLTGASIKLDFKKDLKLQNLMGILEVTFSLPDGSKFTTEKSDIPLATSYECPCLL